MSAIVSANRFSCTLSSAAPDACNYEEIRDRLVKAVVEAHRSSDPQCEVICRVFAGVGKVIVAGETTSEVAVDVEEAARAALRECARERRAAVREWSAEQLPEYVI
jgi:S-adenosylmethionine synthetase